MVVQRNLKVAQALAREAEKKKAEAVRLAIEFDTAKTAAREAGQVLFLFTCAGTYLAPSQRFTLRLVLY